MKLVTPPTQQSGCPSQTGTVPELPSAHLDGVVNSTQLRFSHQYLVSGKFQFWPLSSSIEIVKIPIQYIPNIFKTKQHRATVTIKRKSEIKVFDLESAVRLTTRITVVPFVVFLAAASDCYIS